MAFLFSLASSFSIGAINGYTNGRLDNKLYYGSAALTSMFALMNGINPILQSPVPPAHKLITLLLGSPLVIGATMLNASFMGNALQEVYKPISSQPALSLPSSPHSDA